MEFIKKHSNNIINNITTNINGNNKVNVNENDIENENDNDNDKQNNMDSSNINDVKDDNSNHQTSKTNSIINFVIMNILTFVIIVFSLFGYSGILSSITKYYDENKCNLLLSNNNNNNSKSVHSSNNSIVKVVSFYSSILKMISTLILGLFDISMNKNSNNDNSNSGNDFINWIKKVYSMTIREEENIIQESFQHIACFTKDIKPNDFSSKLISIISVITMFIITPILLILLTIIRNVYLFVYEISNLDVLFNTQLNNLLSFSNTSDASSTVMNILFGIMKIIALYIFIFPINIIYFLFISPIQSIVKLLFIMFSNFREKFTNNNTTKLIIKYSSTAMLLIFSLILTINGFSTFNIGGIIGLVLAFLVSIKLGHEFYKLS